jgi:vesicle-fusing ATPase
LSVLLYGPSGSGKTALAATLSLKSEFPLIKLISPDQMIGYNEVMKCSYLNKTFQDAYRSPLSVIVIDCIERILDYVPIGPRFSNNVLQTLLVLLKKVPPTKGRKLLIIGTTSQKEILSEMGFDDAFQMEIYVPPITSMIEIEHVLREVNLFTDSEFERMISIHHKQRSSLSIGIKKLFMIIERLRQEENQFSDYSSPSSFHKVERFIDYLKKENS